MVDMIAAAVADQYADYARDKSIPSCNSGGSHSVTRGGADAGRW